MRQGHRPVIRVGRIAGAPEAGGGKDDKRPARKEAWIDTSQKLSDQRGKQERQHPIGRDRQARPGRGIAHLGLQPERQQHHIAKEEAITQANGDSARTKVASPEQSQVDDRMGFGPFPDDEDRQPDERDNRQRHDDRRAEPIQLIALVEHDLQRPDPDNDQPETHRIDRHLPYGLSRPASSRQVSVAATSPTGTLM